jgi:hypothetical protein
VVFATGVLEMVRAQVSEILMWLMALSVRKSDFEYVDVHAVSVG